MIIVLLYSLLPDYYRRDLTTWKHFWRLSGSSQWGAANWDWWFMERVCVRVFVCYTKMKLSIGLCRDLAAFLCYWRHNQVRPGGLWLSWPRNTQHCSMGRKLLGGWGWNWWHGVWQRLIIWVRYKCLSCKAVMLLSLSGKIYSRLLGPRGQRMHMREVYLGGKMDFFF